MDTTEKKLRISLVQNNPVWENKKANLAKLDTIISEISDTDIIVLPEMFTTGFTMRTRLLAEDMQGNSVKWMQNHARERNIAICGSIIISDGTKYYNRFLFVTPQEVYYYDKRHLFRMGEEELSYNAGNSRIIINFRGWRILLQVCYDLRFPVWSRNRNDYDILINTANWPSARRKVWDTLLKARAIENQCVVAACNRVGVDGRYIEYNGGSGFINERGELIKQAQDNKEEVLQCKLSLSKLQDFRNVFPAWKDADNYRIITD
ncbi:MAG TPA: amidohydrolase [Bacteroidales bacterium]|nr:amidohydrolase [Bacteroidales bacterium]HRW20475.1 amidohydrolase [Bacteroidales bacterium]HXK82147.1 amidohydrolase [Bacteroidales bacterium]